MSSVNQNTSAVWFVDLMVINCLIPFLPHSTYSYSSAGSTRPDCNWTTKFRSQRTSHVEPSATGPPVDTGTTITGPVGECLQAGTEDAPVLVLLDRPAPLRRLHDSGAGYKYSDLLTYLLIHYLNGNCYVICAVHNTLYTSCVHPARNHGNS